MEKTREREREGDRWNKRGSVLQTAQKADNTNSTCSRWPIATTAVTETGDWWIGFGQWEGLRLGLKEGE